MKTLIAAFVSIGFVATTALACPHQEGTETRQAPKDTAPKTAAAPKPAPVKPAPVKPAPTTIKIAAPKAPSETPKPAGNGNGKVSQR
jgi:hypothetical protein